MKRRPGPRPSPLWSVVLKLRELSTPVRSDEDEHEEWKEELDEEGVVPCFAGVVVGRSVVCDAVPAAVADLLRAGCFGYPTGADSVRASTQKTVDFARQKRTREMENKKDEIEEKRRKRRERKEETEGTQAYIEAEKEEENARLVLEKIAAQEDEEGKHQDRQDTPAATNAATDAAEAIASVENGTRLHSVPARSSERNHGQMQEDGATVLDAATTEIDSLPSDRGADDDREKQQQQQQQQQEEEENTRRDAADTAAASDHVEVAEDEDVQLTMEQYVFPDETWRLSLVDAFFLHHAVGCLSIDLLGADGSPGMTSGGGGGGDAGSIDDDNGNDDDYNDNANDDKPTERSGNKKGMDVDSPVWRAFCRLQSCFVERYACSSHYRSLGWFVRSGLQYGSTFVMYREHPCACHSELCILVASEGVTLSSPPDPDRPRCRTVAAFCLPSACRLAQCTDVFVPVCVCLYVYVYACHSQLPTRHPHHLPGSNHNVSLAYACK